MNAQSIIWQKLYDGYLSNDDEGYDICQTTDNNYCIVGTNSGRIICIKIDQNGDTLWKKNIDAYKDIQGFCLAATTDGGCIISGGYDSSFTLKLNSSGSIIWKKFYPNSTNAMCYSIVRDADNNFIISGKVNTGDAYMMKVNNAGNLIWQRTYTGAYRKELNSICEAIDGGYVSAGYIRNLEFDTTKVFVIKVDTAGNIVWQKSIKIFNNPSVAKVIKKHNNYYLIGGNTSSTNLSEMFFIKADNLGNTYHTTIINTGSIDDVVLNDILVLNDNKYLVASRLDTITTFPHVYAKALIVDTINNILNQRTFITNTSNITDYTYLNKVIKASNGDFILTGDADFGLSNGAEDIYAVRTDSNLNAPVFGIQNISNTIPDNFILYQNYPNPFNPITKIQFGITDYKSKSILKIYSIGGKEIETLVNSNLTPGLYEIIWDASNYPSGVYFYSLQTKTNFITKKMIFIK